MLRAEENRLAQLRCAELRSLGRSLINKIQKQIRTIEECISSLIAQEQTLCAKAQKLTAVTGVGARTAALVLAQMTSWANSIGGKSLRSRAWPRLTMTAVRSAVDAPSWADDLLCVAVFTWPRWRPHVTIQSSRAFTSLCALGANYTNSLSPQCAKTTARPQSHPEITPVHHLKTTQLLMLVESQFAKKREVI